MQPPAFAVGHDSASWYLENAFPDVRKRRWGTDNEKDSQNENTRHSMKSIPMCIRVAVEGIAILIYRQLYPPHHRKSANPWDGWEGHRRTGDPPPL
eukprot:3120632-Rhodomonas_salina.1